MKKIIGLIISIIIIFILSTIIISYFIINNGNAKSEDIINLIDYIKQEVKKHYDIDLVLEQEIIK